MLRQFAQPVMEVFAMLAFSFGVSAQTTPPSQPEATKTHKAARAPRRDLSGICEAVDRMEGIAPARVKTHATFTPLGANIANNVYKPGDVARIVPIGLENDPLDICDPPGVP